MLYLAKSEYDAFYNTKLADILRKSKVENVYLCGVCTDICVFHTAYGAYVRGFKTYIYKDECATFTGLGDIFLEQMARSFKTNIL